VLVILGLAGIVLGALLLLWRGGSRMARAAGGSALLSSALLLEESLLQDVRQLGIDPARRDTFLVSEASFSFYRVHFAGEEIRLRPVRWARRPRAGGGVVLARTEAASGKPVVKAFGHAPLASARFMLVGDRDFGNRYLRVELAMRDPEGGSLPGSTHSLVLRIPTPSELGNPALALASRLVPDADLLPLP
jgi:hypothetical protein